MSFSQILSDWYLKNKRSLPWRSISDPYKIWLSEIILQQTRVNQGMPYYQTFVEKYPTVFDLANAPLQEVLRTWQGLGYYSRARNLHKCAQIVVENYKGNFPPDYEELKKLPGIGSYTAAAIASFAFQIPAPVVDGNVLRFTTRYFGIDKDILKTSTQKEIFQSLSDIIPEDSPAEFNQAIMEFGSIQCIPQSPECSKCPFNQDCFAFNNQKVKVLPYKKKKAKVKSRYFNYFIMELNDKYKMVERKDKDIWKGLYEFHLFESEDRNIDNPDQIDDFQIRELIKNGSLIYESSVYKHILSHQHIFARFFHLKQKENTLSEATDNESYFSFKEIQELPKPVLISKYLEAVSLGK